MSHSIEANSGLNETKSNESKAEVEARTEQGSSPKELLSSSELIVERNTHFSQQYTKSQVENKSENDDLDSLEVTFTREVVDLVEESGPIASRPRIYNPAESSPSVDTGIIFYMPLLHFRFVSQDHVFYLRIYFSADDIK